MNIAITGWKLLVLLFLNFRKIWYTMHFHTLVSKHNIMASSEIDLDTNRQNQKVKLKFYILQVTGRLLFPFSCHFPSVHVLNWVILWSYYAQYTISPSYLIQREPSLKLKQSWGTRLFSSCQVIRQTKRVQQQYTVLTRVLKLTSTLYPKVKPCSGRNLDLEIKPLCWSYPITIDSRRLLDYNPKGKKFQSHKL